jgi:hypothetical protein
MDTMATMSTMKTWVKRSYALTAEITMDTMAR